MAKRAKVRPDREITRAIHALFIEATLVDKWGVIICYATRLPALVLYNVLIPVQIAYAIQAIFTRHFAAIPHFAISIMLLAIGYVILWGVGGLVISRNGAIGSSYIQRHIFGNFLEKDYEFYSNSYFGALGSQAVLLRNVYSDYCQIFMLGGPTQAVIIIAGIGVIAWNSLLLALVTLVSMAVVLSFTILFSSWRLRLRRTLSEASSELAGQVGDALSHGPTVKSFASEAYEQLHLEDSLRTWSNAQFKSWIASVPADAGRMTLAAAATVTLLLMTAYMYQHGTISIAVVTLVQLYVIRMITATQAIAELIKQYEVVMGGAYQSMKTMLIPATITDPESPMHVSKEALRIDFNKVRYQYDDAAKTSTAVRDFNLTIAPGEKIGLVGYSGSGKTTLTKLLLRFMDTTKGSISVGGINVRDLPQRELREHIAYVPQEPLLFHRTIAENISYGKPSASKKRVREVAQMAYVDEFVEGMPKKYETLVGERGVKLSGGQRQRVAIARAILKDAPILILDEATSALDSRSERFIQQALWELMKDRTALVVAHRLSTIQRMDRIAVMNKGQVVQLGSHTELLRDKKGIYAKLWAHQSGGYVGVPAPNDET
ncbi:MAG TPA: ABC transporter ATP-binding protein [Patescibacteria group bacterium]|nr:ABC transporter ATP-binding protein [Patescibacteria group bacterium]